MTATRLLARRGRRATTRWPVYGRRPPAERNWVRALSRFDSSGRFSPTYVPPRATCHCEETLTLLKSCGVDFAQGYQTGRPEPIAMNAEQQVRTLELELRLPPQHSAIGRSGR